MELPNENPVLAKIEYQGDLGLESWCEVVHYNNGKWNSYDGSVTFSNGEYVTEWVYCTDCFSKKQDKWIDISLESPQDDFEVEACCDDDVEMCVYRDNFGFGFFELPSGKEFKATHWKSKPEPFNKIKGE